MRDFVVARIESPAFEPGVAQIAELSGTEHISRLFEFRIRLAALESLDEDTLLTNPATLVFERRGAEGAAPVELRRIPGMIRAVVDRALSESKHREYVVTFVPRAWRATLSQTSDVCMDLKVPDIIKKKLVEVGLDGAKDMLFRLRGDYSAREFVVQYQESHWDFACRLAEDLGIHFSIEEIDGKDVLVFGDANTAFSPSHPDSSPFRERGDQTDVFELEARRELVSKSFVARDYNYRNPSADVLGEAQAPVLGEGKVDEYGPHAKTSAEATFYAKIRAEEASTRSFTFEGKSDLPGLRAGSLLTVKGHPRGDVEIVVTEVVHELIQPVFGVVTANERPYKNSFHGIPKGIPYRPARLTPKPRVHGVVTGIVESESSTKMGAIDDQGRYRVAFMYDSVTGRGDGKASRPLRMAQPSAGSARGFHLPLRPGTEVLVTCVNGDPDRPIIAGAVNNPQTPSPVTAGNAEKSMWTTNVNSIAIDDDKPRCKVSVAGENHVFQIGEPNAPEQGITSATIANSSSITNLTATAVSKNSTAANETTTTITHKSAITVVGIPSPFEMWKEYTEKVDKVAEFLKSSQESVKTAQESATKFAKLHKKEATEHAAETAKKLLHAKIEAAKKTPPKPGESDKEWTERAKESDPELAAADKEAEEAHKDAEDAEKDVKELEDGWADSKWNLDATRAGVVTQGALQAYANVKAGMNLWISHVSDKVSEAAGEVALELMKAAHSGAKAAVGSSGQRSKAKVGKFAKACAITNATNSVGLLGDKHAFVGAGLTTAVFAAEHVTVAGGLSAHLKSPVTAEVAARKVRLSAKDVVDVDSRNDIHVTAKNHISLFAQEKNIVVTAKQDLLATTKEGKMEVEAKTDIHVKAGQHISLFAEEKNVIVTAKVDVIASAKDGKVEVEAGKTATVTSKEKITLESKDADFALLAGKAGTVRAKEALKMNCKSGAFKASGDMNLNGKNVYLNGDKISIG